MVSLRETVRSGASPPTPRRHASRVACPPILAPQGAVASRGFVAIYSVQMKSLSRGKGDSATAAAAYRAGLSLDDPTTGERHDYTRRAGVLSVDMLAPPGAVAWATDPTQVWAQVEQAETRKNARVGREVVMALPHEFDQDARRDLACEVGQYLVDRYGVAAQVAVHAPDKDGDERNYHAHILFTPRQVGAEGFTVYAAKVYDEFKAGAEELKILRAAVAERTNQALNRAGRTARVDHRTLVAQKADAVERGDFKAAVGLDRLPTKHEGKATTQARRRGERTPRARRNDRRQQANERRQDAHEARFQRLKAEAQADGRLTPTDEQAAHARALLERTREGRTRLRQAAIPSPTSTAHVQPNRPARFTRAPALAGDSRHPVGVPSGDRPRGLQPLPPVRALDGSATGGRPQAGGHAGGPGGFSPVARGVLRKDAPGHRRPGGPVLGLQPSPLAAKRAARSAAPATRPTVPGGAGKGSASLERAARSTNRTTVETVVADEANKQLAALIEEMLLRAKRALQQSSALTPWQRATARGVLETHRQAQDAQQAHREAMEARTQARAVVRRARADRNYYTMAEDPMSKLRRAMGRPSAGDRQALNAAEALAQAKQNATAKREAREQTKSLSKTAQRDAEKAREQFADAFGLVGPKFGTKERAKPHSTTEPHMQPVVQPPTNRTTPRPRA